MCGLSVTRGCLWVFTAVWCRFSVPWGKGIFAVFSVDSVLFHGWLDYGKWHGVANSAIPSIEMNPKERLYSLCWQK